MRSWGEDTQGSKEGDFLKLMALSSLCYSALYHFASLCSDLCVSSLLLADHGSEHIAVHQCLHARFVAYV